jgi:Flp pilus assembly protein TadB
MSMVVLAAAAAWLAMPGGAVRVPSAHVPANSRRGERTRPAIWALSAGIGAWAFVGGIPGVAAGGVAAVAVWVVLCRAEPPGVRRRRLRVRAELPHVVGLLASGVRSGLPPAEALRLVCTALPGPAADALSGLPGRIEMGVDPIEVWRSLEADAALAPLGRSLARSVRTGEPVAEALERLGEELAARARAEVEDAARRVGVQAAVPLGVCLLPAFLLLGVVPVVAGLVARVTA